jgi:hypothetical protein
MKVFNNYGPMYINVIVLDKFSMSSNFLWCVPHNLLQSLVPVFFQALGMEI